MKQKETFSIFKMLSLILQLGLIVMAPVLLAVLLVIFVPKIGGPVAAVLIILALITGAYAAFRVAFLVIPKDEPEETFDLLEGWKEENDDSQ